MKKANVLKSSEFHMDEGDVLHLLFTSELYTSPTITLNSVTTGGTDNRELPPDAPVALDASDITSTSFSANVNLMENTLGFYLDVATDSAFTAFVAGYNDLDIGLVDTYPVVGLSDATTYYYRLRGYNDYGTGQSSNTITTLTDIENVVDADGNVYTYVTIGSQQWMVENLKTTKYADGTAIPNLIESSFDDWFMPSRDEAEQMYINLHLFGVGGFESASYPTSSEFSATNIWTFGFHTGTSFSGFDKTFAENFRPCRIFTAGIGEYNLRDIGEAGGLIFYINGVNYYEAYPTDINLVVPFVAWSNIQALAIGTTGTAIGTGQANTTAIIAQAGHTNSNAKLCNDLSSGGWINDTTGAYCYYNNDIANKADYGALYNWYAVDNAHGLAPTGWRVPTPTDWDDLITVAGDYDDAGGVLKEVGLAHWLTPNAGATDDYGFKMLGAGKRSELGVFSLQGENALLWADSSGFGLTAYHINNDMTSTGGVNNANGYSIRCMRDVTP